MTVIEAVDLAAKMSAVNMMLTSRDTLGSPLARVLSPQLIIKEFDSYGMSEAEFVRQLTEPFDPFSSKWRDHPEVLVIEDLPHRLPFASLVKKVCRLQGRIIHQMNLHGHKDKILFVPPATWQRSYDGVWKSGASGAATTASSFGYNPPDTLDLYQSFIPESGKDRSKIRADLKKLQSDYVDAFLIAKWAVDTLDSQGTLDVPTTSRVQ